MINETEIKMQGNLMYMTPGPVVDGTKTLHKPPNAKKRIAKDSQYTPDSHQQKETINKLTMARVRMLLNHPFFGNLVTRLVLTDASAWCHTLATDGKYLYFNAEFVNSLSDG